MVAFFWPEKTWGNEQIPSSRYWISWGSMIPVTSLHAASSKLLNLDKAVPVRCQHRFWWGIIRKWHCFRLANHYLVTHATFLVGIYPSYIVSGLTLFIPPVTRLIIATYFVIGMTHQVQFSRIDPFVVCICMCLCTFVCDHRSIFVDGPLHLHICWLRWNFSCSWSHWHLLLWQWERLLAVSSRLVNRL